MTCVGAGAAFAINGAGDDCFNCPDAAGAVSIRAVGGGTRFRAGALFGGMGVVSRATSGAEVSFRPGGFSWGMVTGARERCGVGAFSTAGAGAAGLTGMGAWGGLSGVPGGSSGALFSASLSNFSRSAATSCFSRSSSSHFFHIAAACWSTAL